MQIRYRTTKQQGGPLDSVTLSGDAVERWLGVSGPAFAERSIDPFIHRGGPSKGKRPSVPSFLLCSR